MSQSPRYFVHKALLPLVIALVLIILQQILSIPGESRVARGLQNSLHAPWFFTLVLLGWWWARATLDWPLKKFLAAAALGSLGLAVFTELAQVLGPRDADPGDILLNMLGAGAALTLAYGYEKRQQLTASKIGALVITAGLLIGAGLSPVLGALYVNTVRNAIAPRLVDFSSPAMGALVRHRASHRLIETAPVGWPGYSGNQVARIVLDEGYRYPGIILRQTYPDWNDYEWLVIDAFLPPDDSLSLELRLEPWAEHQGHPIRQLSLEPGPNSIRIPLRSLFEESAPEKHSRPISAAAQGRGQNTDTEFTPGTISRQSAQSLQVRDLQVYGSRRDVGRWFWLGDIRLE